VVLLAFVCLRTVSAVSGPLLNQYLNDRSGDASRATTLSAAAMSRQLVIAPTKLAVGILAGATLSYAVAGLGVVLLAGTAVAAILGGPVQRGGSTPEGATAGP
jgi:hypothetical protein